jgi:acetyl esterase/lipase
VHLPRSIHASVYTFPVIGTFWMLLVAVSWAFAAWSLLTLVRVPLYLLWKPAVAATEWGHWLLCFALATAVAGLSTGRLIGVVVPASLAVILFASPSVRAMLLARRIQKELDQVFPLRAKHTAGDFSRPSPFVVSNLPHIPIPAVERNRVVYREVDETRLTLDWYRAKDTSGKLPVIIVVHGGSWRGGDNSQLEGMNRYLAAAGYAVAAINYRLAPAFRFPAPIEDIRGSISFLEERADEFGIDSSRVVLLGRSAGGHLALLAAYTLGHEAIRGVVGLYPPTDMHWSWQHPSPKRIMDSNGAITDFLGGTLEEVPDTFDQASPIRFVRPDSPPTLLIHGGKDMLVSPLQSNRLATELEREIVPHFHLELGWGNHGMDANLAGPSGQMTLYAMERFLGSVMGS